MQENNVYEKSKAKWIADGGLESDFSVDKLYEISKLNWLLTAEGRFGPNFDEALQNGYDPELRDLLLWQASGDSIKEKSKEEEFIVMEKCDGDLVVRSVFEYKVMIDDDKPIMSWSLREYIKGKYPQLPDCTSMISLFLTQLRCTGIAKVGHGEFWKTAELNTLTFENYKQLKSVLDKASRYQGLPEYYYSKGAVLHRFRFNVPVVQEFLESLGYDLDILQQRVQDNYGVDNDDGLWDYAEPDEPEFEPDEPNIPESDIAKYKELEAKAVTRAWECIEQIVNTRELLRIKKLCGLECGLI